MSEFTPQIQETTRFEKIPIPAEHAPKFEPRDKTPAGMAVHSSDKNADSRYTLGEIIGTGGEAEVRYGWDHKLGIMVAIKIAKADPSRYTLSPELHQPLEASIQAEQDIHNPHIIKVLNQLRLNYGYYEKRPTVATVLEYLSPDEYQTLLKYVQDQNTSPDLIGEIIKQSAEAVDILHGNNAKSSEIDTSPEKHTPGLNLDIKSENMLFNPKTKTLKFGDFGTVAKINNADTESEGLIFGTIPYLSPERVIRQTPSSADDLWSHAIIAFELITNTRPFNLDSDNDHVYRLYRIAGVNGLKDDDITLLRNSLVNKGISETTEQDSIINQFKKAFSREKDSRFSSASEFATPIVNILQKPKSEPPSEK